MCSVPCKVDIITILFINTTITIAILFINIIITGALGGYLHYDQLIIIIIIFIFLIARNVVLYTHYSGEVSNIVDEHFTKALNQTTFSELKGDDDDHNDDDDNGDDDDLQKGKGAAVALTDVTG